MAVNARLKGLTLQQRTAQIMSEVPKPGPGHHKSHQQAHIQQWLLGKKESGSGFPPAHGGGTKMAGKVPPQFLKHMKGASSEEGAGDPKGDSEGAGDQTSAAGNAKGKIPPQFLKGHGHKSSKAKKAGRSAAVAKRLAGGKKGSLPPWLAKK